MNELIRHIEYLLRSHDCVVIPGIGALLAEYKEAYYDVDAQMFYPPVREVVFNPSISHNDGLIANSVARREEISYETALRKVNEECNALRRQLDADGELSLGHIGNIRLNGDRMEFTPMADSAISPDLFRMSPVSVTRLADRDSESEKKVATILHLRKSSWVKIAASVAAVIIFAIFFSTPVLTDLRGLNFAGFITSQDVEPDEIIPVMPDIELCIAEPDTVDGCGMVDTTAVRAMIDIRKPYYLVVASLGNRQQAETFVKQHAGSSYRLEIVETETKTRVIANSGNSAREVMAVTENVDFAAEFPNAWPCHK